jgi:hypothetical protein
VRLGVSWNCAGYRTNRYRTNICSRPVVTGWISLFLDPRSVQGSDSGAQI